MLSDLRYAVRTLRKNWGFTFAAVTALGLGIGATTTIFSLLTPFIIGFQSVEDIDRIVTVWSSNAARGEDMSVVSLPDFTDWRDATNSFEVLAAREVRLLNLAGIDEPMRVTVGRVHANYFSVYRIQPELGRAFATGEDRPGSPTVVVLGYGLWNRGFGGDRSVVGREISLDGTPATIVGVLGRTQETRCCELYVPLTADPGVADRGERAMFVNGRLRPGVTIEQAEQELVVIAERIAQDHPLTNAGWSVNVTPIADELLSGEALLSLALLIIAVLLVLAIACVNVANLLLARSATRRQEMVVRGALGARPRRLVRQLLTESVVLGLGGGALGVGLAFLGVRALANAFAVGEAIREFLVVDGRVLLFALGTSVSTGLIFGLVPALQAARPDLRGMLNEGGRSGPARTHRVRQTLIAAEVALALVLLVAGGLMTRTLGEMVRLDPGFDSERLLTLRVSLPEQRYPDQAQALAFFDTALDRTAALPGVDAVGVTSRLPFVGSRNNPTRSFAIEGRPAGTAGEAPSGNELIVSPGYLSALGVPLVSGRRLTAADSADAPPVTVVSQALATRYFANTNPVGARLRIGAGDLSADTPWVSIVGVVGDIRNDDLGAQPEAQLYRPVAQQPRHAMSLLARTSGEPDALVAAMRREIQSIDPEQPIFAVQTMTLILFGDTSGPRLVIGVLGVFALLALLLAAVGIYGVVSYTATQRTREVGIRMALGAGTGDVLRLILGQGMVPVAAGMVVGLAISLAITRLIAGILFQVSPTDPLTFGGVTLLLGSVGLLASLIPAVRAGRLQPVAALRDE